MLSCLSQAGGLKHDRTERLASYVHLPSTDVYTDSHTIITRFYEQNVGDFVFLELNEARYEKRFSQNALRD